MPAATIRPPVDPTLLRALPIENLVALLQIGIETHALLLSGFAVTVATEPNKLVCTLRRRDTEFVVQMAPGQDDVGGAGVVNLGELLARATAYAREMGAL